MKRISSIEQDLLPNVSDSALDAERSSRKVRKSLALLGLALSVGTAGVLINQQNSKDLKVTPVAQSPQTLADVLAQNKDRKYELARTAIASGSWDSQQGVVVHEVREDETLYQLTQIYQVDAAAIAASNNISSATPLQPGMKLVIPPVNGIVHKVKPGDTLEAIARFYKVPEGEIVKYTALKSPEFLAIDQPLVIPGNVASLIQVREEDAKVRLVAERDRLRRKLEELEGKPVLVSATANQIKKPQKYAVYKVQNGDTVETIARRYGISQTLIVEYNKLDNPHWLELGQELKIPLGKNTATLQTVAASNTKPLKVIPSLSTPSNATETKPEITAKINSLSGTKVTAATPMVIDPSKVASQVNTQTTSNTTVVASAPKLSPWDGLMQLSGADFQKSVPADPAQEIGSAKQPLATANSTLPIATEPVIKLAASLLPFTSEKLLEQQLASTIAKSDAVIGQPAVEPNVTLPKKVAAAPSVPSGNILEQNIAASSSIKPSVNEQPVAEPSVAVPKVAAAPSVPSGNILEQNIAASNPSATALKSQPVAEPNVSVAPLAAAPSVIAAPIKNAIEQKIGNSKPTELAMLPDSEARMTSVEVKRLEAEVGQLNAKVREAEVKAAARQAEATKIAAANIRPAANPDRNFDTSREAIANPNSGAGLPPEMPSLVAANYLPDASNYGISTGFIWPAEGVLTSGFGWRWGRVHQGIDIAAPVGTPILAAASGVVDYAGWNDGGYGNMIDIRHPDGTITRYGHLSAIYVKEGQTINQAQLIAAMGSTGYSTGPHLHFEIRPRGGSAVDPMGFLASNGRG